MNILIIEDEIKTAKDLKQMIERVDDRLQVAGMVPSVRAGIDWLRTNPAPRLILSDIQLSDGLSFEIFRVIPPPCPVIFCTAFDQYAIRAFEANGMDYLLKPIDEEKLGRAFQRYEQMRQLFTVDSPPETTRLKALLNQFLPTGHRSTLLVFRNEKIIPLATADVAFFHSSGGMVHAHTKSGQVYAIQQVLDELEPVLDSYRFFRANRQFIINRDVLVMAEHYFNRRLIAKLSVETPERIIVSKVRTRELLSWMAR